MPVRLNTSFVFPRMLICKNVPPQSLHLSDDLKYFMAGHSSMRRRTWASGMIEMTVSFPSHRECVIRVISSRSLVRKREPIGNRPFLPIYEYGLAFFKGSE